ncbi:hypothetical protein EON65_30370 [archaeon]|nr:MAG: hypothetical protein EON65_30370 [archaeon]
MSRFTYRTIVPKAVSRNTIQASRPASTKMSNVYYTPALYVDEIGLTSDKYVHLNSSVEELPIKISIGPMSVKVDMYLVRYGQLYLFYMFCDI